MRPARQERVVCCAHKYDGRAVWGASFVRAGSCMRCGSVPSRSGPAPPPLPPSRQNSTPSAAVLVLGRRILDAAAGASGLEDPRASSSSGGQPDGGGGGGGGAGGGGGGIGKRSQRHRSASRASLVTRGGA
eukprot:357554-Chlamydomonas_euryale.AAC.15